MEIDKKNLRIVFMGTPEFSQSSLKALVDSEYNVIGVFTNPDRPSGRGLKLQMSPVKKYAMEKNIPVFQPKKLNVECVEILNQLKPDVICVVAYGKILPKNILKLPKYGCINVHGSLLPKYRGAAPIQWSLINGDKTTGITTMYMDEGMDTGDMLLKESVDILDTDNYLTLHDKLKQIGATLLVTTLDELRQGNLTRITQPEIGTYAPMIAKSISKLDFNKTPKQLYNLVRGLSPFMGTYMYKDDVRYKVFDIEYKEQINNDDSTFEFGQIVEMDKTKLGIKCKGGYIYINTIQPENSRKMNISEFLVSNKFKLGDKLN